MIGSSPALVRAVLFVLCLPAIAAAQVPAAPQLNPASVSGNSVSVSWSAVPGALSYRVEAAITPGPPQAAYEVGPITSFTLNVPPGTYFLRVLARNLAGLGAPSNVITIAVGTNPPAAPQNFQATVTGSTVNLSVQLPPGPLAALALSGGLTPGARDILVPLPVGTAAAIPGVPNGVYYARLHAVNAAGLSPASNEVQIVVGGVGCTPPSGPAVSAEASGSIVNVTWSAVAGASGYRLDAAASAGGSPIFSQGYGPQTTGLTASGVTPGTYYVRVTASTPCGQATSAEVAVTVTGSTGGGGNRTPNPPPGQRLPLPNRSQLVAQLGQQFNADLRNSCVTSGGNNTWLYRVVQRLRQEDTRWGLNWKRGRVGDMSQDVITYNYGANADEGTTDVYIIDIIGGHCGSSPSASWVDNTDVTIQSGTIGRWTLQPYTAAGWQ